MDPGGGKTTPAGPENASWEGGRQFPQFGRQFPQLFGGPFFPLGDNSSPDSLETAPGRAELAPEAVQRQHQQQPEVVPEPGTQGPN